MASSKMPKMVVFDVGNVLVNFDYQQLYGPLLATEPVSEDPLWGRVDFAAMNHDGDLGLLANAVQRRVDAHPEDAQMIWAWWRGWEEMFTPAIPGSAALLAEVKALGLPVAALTNFAADTWTRGQMMYPVLKAFDLEVVSGREGVMKPDPAFYEIFEQRAGLQGADLFFTDDKPENIAAAKDRGWRAHLFQTAGGLRAALRAVGLAL